jgi:hypothetical protein
MKKILLTGLTLGLLGSLTAQNWVSTTPENRKVVLEEFTGVRCTFCPDGHKRAQEMKDANKGKVFLINVHAGSFATPGAGDLDLRTPEGTALDNAAGTLGYPNGSVNRNKSPWNSSRNAWASEGTGIMGESSPVNVYVKSSVDYTTRTLTTEVEVYYTAAGKSTNRLSIALLQNELLGPQVGGTTFYPENYYNNQYIHNHAFRRFITSNGVDGETLDSTTSGAYIYRKFTTVLPAKIGPIDLDINKMEVVAFVTDNGRNKIWSGAQADVSTNDPTVADLAATNNTIAPTGLCGTISPKISIKNNGASSISSFDIDLKQGNTIIETKSYSGSLASGMSTEIVFTSINGNGEYAYSTDIKNLNSGALTDNRFSNNNINITGLAFTPKAFSYGKFGFNTPGSMPANTGRDMSKNPNMAIVNYNQNIGQSSQSAMRFDLRSSLGVSGKAGHIILGEADFTGITDPEVNYYYAYSAGTFGGTQPEVRVSVSEDCGATWKNVNTFTCISTFNHTSSTTYYVPRTGHYKQVKVDLTSYANKTVLVRVSGVPGTNGNALYIDQVEIGSANKILSTPSVKTLGFNVYPNPAKDNITVNTTASNAVINLVNLNGQVIKTMTISNGTGSFDVSDLTKGIYLVEVTSNGVKEVSKITVL